MFKKSDIKILRKHALIGLVCFILNLVLMWLLVALANVSILIATTICFIAISVLGHDLSRRFAFTDATNSYKGSLSRFIFIMSINLLCNLTAMAIAVYIIGLPYLIASACIAALFFFANFIIHRDWTFH